MRGLGSGGKPLEAVLLGPALRPPASRRVARRRRELEHVCTSAGGGDRTRRWVPRALLQRVQRRERLALSRGNPMGGGWKKRGALR